MYVVGCLFKQKTAYEMRISDWSSDVCSSDLIAETDLPVADGLDDGCIVQRPPAVVTDVAQKFRHRFEDAADLADRSVSLDDDGEHLQRGDQRIAGGDVIVEDNMAGLLAAEIVRSEEHTSEFQSLMRISYAVICLTKK